MNCLEFAVRISFKLDLITIQCLISIKIEIEDIWIGFDHKRSVPRQE